MIEMRTRQQQIVYGGGIKPERLTVFLVHLAAALEQPAIDQDAPPRSFDEMTRAGHAAIGAMERQFQRNLPRMNGSWNGLGAGTRLLTLQGRQVSRSDSS